MFEEEYILKLYTCIAYNLFTSLISLQVAIIIYCLHYPTANVYLFVKQSSGNSLSSSISSPHSPFVFNNELELPSSYYFDPYCIKSWLTFSTHTHTNEYNYNTYYWCSVCFVNTKLILNTRLPETSKHWTWPRYFIIKNSYDTASHVCPKFRL